MKVERIQGLGRFREVYLYARIQEIKNQPPSTSLNLSKLLYAAGGKSIAKHEGKVVFIEGAVPGDQVDVRLLKNKKDWAEGKVSRFRKYSDERVTPFCQHFGVCGGCKWQMLPYEKQLQYKEEEVASQMKRIGKINLPDMMPIIGASETRYYRNKLEYTFSSKKYFTEQEIAELPMSDEGPKGLPSIPSFGFHVPGSFDKVIDIEACFLQSDPSNAIRNQLRTYALSKGYTFYDIRNHVGLLRNLMIRLCTTGELMINLVFGEDDQAAQDDLLNFLHQTFPSITSLYYTINKKFNDSLHDQSPCYFQVTPLRLKSWVSLSLRLVQSHSFRPTPSRLRSYIRSQEILQTSAAQKRSMTFIVVLEVLVCFYAIRQKKSLALRLLRKRFRMPMKMHY